jgi:Bacteriocin-protection, YdeI or OmpD-Associated/Domain of unknown function (DUF1905)
MRFETEVELGGKTATGLEVPGEVVDSLGAGRRPAVTVTIGGHVYRSTVAVMGGRYLLPLSAENRTAAGVTAGERVEVDVELDAAPREVTVPDDLQAGFADHPEAATFFASLAPSHRKEWVRWIEDAKRPQTREDRVAKTLTGLLAGRRTH